MVLPANYLDSIAVAREDLEPLCMPWPMPGNPASFPSFTTFAAWREFVLQFSLHPSLPLIVSTKFERAQKLYILTWIDFDLIKADEFGRADGARTGTNGQIPRLDTEFAFGVVRTTLLLWKSPASVLHLSIPSKRVGHIQPVGKKTMSRPCRVESLRHILVAIAPSIDKATAKFEIIE